MTSGLQQEILGLYRQFVRIAIARKDSGGLQMIRSAFGRHRNVNIRDITTIEYFLRRGRHQLEWFAKGDVQRVTIWTATSKALEPSEDRNKVEDNK